MSECKVCKGNIAADDPGAAYRSPTELAGYCTKDCARVDHVPALHARIDALEMGLMCAAIALDVKRSYDAAEDARTLARRCPVCYGRNPDDDCGTVPL